MRRRTIWVWPVVVAMAAVAVGCSSQPRADPDVTAPTLASGETIPAGEPVSVELDLSTLRSFRHAAVGIAFTTGEITNIDPETGEVVAAGEDWLAILDAEVTKVIDAEYPISGRSAGLTLSDDRLYSNRNRDEVDPPVGATEPKRFVFQVPPGASWDRAVFEFGDRGFVQSSVPLTGPAVEPALPIWLEPGALGETGTLGILVVEARVTVDSSDGLRADRDTKFVEATIQLANNGDEAMAIGPGLFRMVAGDSIVDPLAAPALSLTGGSSITAPVVFVVPFEADEAELLVNAPNAAAAVSVPLDLASGQPDDQPYPAPSSLIPADQVTSTSAVPETTDPDSTGSATSDPDATDPGTDDPDSTDPGTDTTVPDEETTSTTAAGADTTAADAGG